MNLDLGRVAGSETPWRLDADSLTTHGVVLGMTGSGKTGLALTLLEELAARQVPLLLIDPKGDLGNLGLLYPGASAEELLPWVDAAAAARQGISAQVAAAAWSERIAAERTRWGITPERVESLKEKLGLRIYTPGWAAGRPVNVMSALAAPVAALPADELGSWAEAVARATLALVGWGDPEAGMGREGTLLSQILLNAWSTGESLTLEDLTLRVADPPFRKMGVFPLESFFPSAARLELAMKFNTLLMSPSWSAWSQGEPLEPGAWLSGGTSLVYLAHLDDAARMFFVSLLLARVRAWSRSLPGAQGLRALLFFDEVAGYLPPHPAQPPSKAPLLGLLKQARAAGLGVVLATQNPVDLDYKALSNTGTWWVGRLPTEQDQARVEEGLREAGQPTAELRTAFAALQPRRFLVRNASGTQVVETRSTMALLRGPLTPAELTTAAPGPVPKAAPTVSVAPPPAPDEGSFSVPPGTFLAPEVVFSERLRACFEPWARARREDGRLFWQPALWGELQLRFDEAQGGFVLDESHHYLAFPLAERLEWRRLPLEAADLCGAPAGPGCFAPLPEEWDEAREWKAAQAELVQDVFQRVTGSQWVHAGLKLYGAGGQPRAEFEGAVRQAIEDRIDARLAQMHDKVQRRVNALEEKLRKGQARLDGLRSSSQQRQGEALWSAGRALLSLFDGRASRVGGALSAHGRSRQADQRMESAQEDVNQLQAELNQLSEEVHAQRDAIRAEEEQALTGVQQRTVRLERSDIRVARFGVLWIPLSRRA